MRGRILLRRPGGITRKLHDDLQARFPYLGPPSPSR
jgi:hypothetical protein